MVVRKLVRRNLQPPPTVLKLSVTPGHAEDCLCLTGLIKVVSQSATLCVSGKPNVDCKVVALCDDATMIPNAANEDVDDDACKFIIIIQGLELGLVHPSQRWASRNAGPMGVEADLSLRIS